MDTSSVSATMTKAQLTCALGHEVADSLICQQLFAGNFLGRIHFLGQHRTRSSDEGFNLARARENFAPQVGLCYWNGAKSFVVHMIQVEFDVNQRVIHTHWCLYYDYNLPPPFFVGDSQSNLPPDQIPPRNWTRSWSWNTKLYVWEWTLKFLGASPAISDFVGVAPLRVRGVLWFFVGEKNSTVVYRTYAWIIQDKIL